METKTNAKPIRVPILHKQASPAFTTNTAKGQRAYSTFSNLLSGIPNGSTKTQDSKNADSSLQTSIRTLVCDEEAPSVSARGLMSIFVNLEMYFVCYKFSVKCWVYMEIKILKIQKKNSKEHFLKYTYMC